ncbi:MAG: hypothetical protein GKR96_14950 [Gammaproteobacteria bacterium]|nr:hypothetical protein [Gammaproteobacteria bacterium]
MDKFHRVLVENGDVTDHPHIPITQRYHSEYNFFGENPNYIPHLLACIREVLPGLEFPVAVQSWVNIYRKGQGIKWHTHGGKNGYSYSANVFLNGETTPGIYYSVNPNDVFNVENETGSMHIFPHSLNHMVPPIESSQKRYTLGITIHGLQAIDKPLIQGAALDRNHRETIFLSGE